MWCKVFIFCVAVSVINAAKLDTLPSFMKLCPRKSGNFNECALNNAKEAILALADGDKQFKLPTLKPFHVELVELDAGNLNLSMRNIDTYGLEKTMPLSIKADFDAQRIELISKVDRIEITGDYEINGKILLFPIQGKGPCKIILEGGVFNFTFYYDLEEKNGKTYASMSEEKSHLDYTLDNVVYQFDNLFNGDKTLGDQMNKLMTENWRDVDKDFKPSFIKTIKTIYIKFARNIYTKVPYENMFSD